MMWLFYRMMICLGACLSLSLRLYLSDTSNIRALLLFNPILFDDLKLNTKTYAYNLGCRQKILVLK